jgi:hypothetical protein
MFTLPTSLARHFHDSTGHVDYQALLRTSDHELLALARGLAPAEREQLLGQLLNLRLSGSERALLHLVGIDVDAQQGRFLRILQEAAYAEAVEELAYLT